MPLLPGTPDINTRVTACFDFTIPGVMMARGSAYGDDFPNLEAFLVSPSGHTALLVDAYTTGGKNTGPLTRLLGSHDDQLLAQFNQSIPVDRQGELKSDIRGPRTVMREWGVPAWMVDGG
jgi:hypothetical protein